MSRTFKFVALLIVGLGVLTWGASVVVTSTTRSWFERDLALRGELVVQSSRRALVVFLREHSRAKVEELLEDITHDERIMGSAVCDAEMHLVGKTREFPHELSCRELGAKAHADGGWATWRETRDLDSGPVHVSALPVIDDGEALGFVVLVHDISFVGRRDAVTHRYLLAAFAFLALAAALITIIAARVSWRSWSEQLKRFLLGDGDREAFHPLIKDFRELVDRIAAEREGDGGSGRWTPQRLKRTLAQALEGERVIIVANREPYIHERKSDGSIAVVHPASGLVTALEPVMRACSGVWVAHGSGSADADTADAQGKVRVPPGDESYVLKRVWLSEAEEKGYYYGLANEGLWPLCHMAHTRPTFRSEDWLRYQAVNQRFAEAACNEADTDDPVILVQDYHFALAPRFIRALLPRATILTFWHIPWPNPEQFGICPWRSEILEGLLGSSIIGFHTQLHCNNFIDAVDRYMEARIDRERTAVVSSGETTLVRPYPISIEWPNRWAVGTPPAKECRAEIFAELGLPENALLGVGVDRLDYTKGIVERLLAVERLLERFPSYRGRFTFVQLAAPSRTVIESYRGLQELLERTASRINGRFAHGDYRPVILKRSHHEPPTVFKYYRAADLCYVSSLHDGMNLVAKEFVAAREDEAGVLVLSQFTGAARELGEALIVNPYDLEQASAGLATALSMGAQEQRERMHAMRTFLEEFNVYRWAGRMLVDAARVRKRGRLSSRLTKPFEVLEGGRQ